MVQQMKWWQISKNSLYVRIYIVHTLAHHMHVRKDNLLPQMWIRAKLGKYIPYSGKLWRALNLANQSPERFQIGEF